MSGGSSSRLLNVSLVAHDRMGGHTIPNHVGKSTTWLEQRLLREPTISSASTFPDLNTAELAVNGAIQANLSKIYNWLASGTGLLLLEHVYGFNIGTVLIRNCPAGVVNPSPTAKVRVIVKRLGSAYPNFLLRTAFPIM